MSDNLDPLEAVAASELVTSALVASLIPVLVERGILSAQDAREVYETALLLIETQQADDSAAQRVYEAAREAIESHLGSDWQK